MPATREERGRMIAEKANQIMRLEERFYKVASQNGHGMYDVTKRKVGAWLCTCPDFTHRNVQCKHIWAVQFSLRIREQVEARVIEPITDIHAGAVTSLGHTHWNRRLLQVGTQWVWGRNGGGWATELRQFQVASSNSTNDSRRAERTVH